MSYPGQVFEDPDYYVDPEQDIMDYLNEELAEVDEIYGPYVTVNS
jgi:hypothetical protein